MTTAYVLDRATRATRGRLDEGYAALSFTRRLWAMDTFELTIQREQLYADQLALGRLLYLPDAGDLLFMVEQIHAVREGSRANDVLTVSGRSFEGIALAERHCVPPAGQSHDTVSAVAAETAIKHYVNRNAGPLAPAALQVPGLAIAADQARGLVLSASARYQIVLDQLRELGLLAGIGWKITYDDVADNFPFDVVIGVDRSASVFFDFDFETLESTEELDTVLESKTVAIVAGQGEGADREIVVRWLGATEPTGFDRREVFVDARDVELGQTAILQQRGDALLAAAGGQRALEARAHQHGSFRYREHWDLGDVVLVRDEHLGVSFTARIVEIEEIRTADSAPQVKAVLGRPFPTDQDRVDGPGPSGAVVDRAVRLPAEDLPLATKHRTAGDYTTASTTFVDVDATNMAVTVVLPRAGVILVCFTGVVFNNTSLKDVYLDIEVDGVRMGGAGGLNGETIINASADVHSGSFSVLTDVLAAGSHTLKLQWRVTGGTGTLRGTNTNQPARLSAAALYAA